MIPNEMHQFDLLCMPTDMLYGNEYSLWNQCHFQIQSHQTHENATGKRHRHMIANIYKVGPLTYPKVFQCDNGSEFKAGVTKLLEKHGSSDDMACDDEVPAHSHGIH